MPSTQPCAPRSTKPLTDSQDNSRDGSNTQKARAVKTGRFHRDPGRAPPVQTGRASTMKGKTSPTPSDAGDTFNNTGSNEKSPSHKATLESGKQAVKKPVTGRNDVPSTTTAKATTTQEEARRNHHQSITDCVQSMYGKPDAVKEIRQVLHQHAETAHIMSTGDKPRSAEDVAHINFLLREVLPFEITHLVFAFALKSPPVPFFVYFDVPEWESVKTKGYFPCATFRGSKPGLCFKMGDLGVGYYRNVQPATNDDALIESLLKREEEKRIRNGTSGSIALNAKTATKKSRLPKPKPPCQLAVPPKQPEKNPKTIHDHVKAVFGNQDAVGDLRTAIQENAATAQLMINSDKPRSAEDVAHINFLLREVLPFEITHLVFAFALKSPPVPFFVYFDVPEWESVKTKGYFPCATFRGSKPGLCFKMGDLGVGYYRNIQPATNDDALIESLLKREEEQRTIHRLKKTIPGTWNRSDCWT